MKARFSPLSSIRRLALLALCWPCILNAADLEAKIKAAYIYHLTEFIEWPSLPADEFRICVIGAEQVARLLADLSGRMVYDRPLKVDSQVDDHPQRCQLLFIDRNEDSYGAVLRAVAGSSVLTVSDIENFARQGGGIGFYSDAGKLKLEINPASLHAANFRISSKLLELARSVP